jgi:hypothetical protein
MCNRTMTWTSINCLLTVRQAYRGTLEDRNSPVCLILLTWTLSSIDSSSSVNLNGGYWINTVYYTIDEAYLFLKD